MSLYAQKDSNIRKTWLLFSVFLVVVIGVGWVFSKAYGNPGILIFAVLFSVITSFVSYWYSDKIVLKISKAKLVSRRDMPELYNLVDNLSITAGLPMPRVYIMEEPAPNAFATGRDPKHAVVAVTRGLLQRLDKAELEGVLAHEMSHIGNRDILLSTVVVVLVGFVALMADFFTRSMIFGGLGRSRDDSDRGQAAGIFMLVGIALAILAPIATTLMQLAISRKREFLADASGALLTRYPEGLARALEKISKDPTPISVVNKATNHLWVSEPKKRGFGTAKVATMFMTHPPIEERVKRLREIKL